MGVSVNGIPLTTVTADSTNLNNTVVDGLHLHRDRHQHFDDAPVRQPLARWRWSRRRTRRRAVLPVASGPATPTTTQVVNDPAAIATGGITINAIAGIPTGLVQVASFTDPGGLEPNPADPSGTIHTHYNATINWGTVHRSPATRRWWSMATPCWSRATILTTANHTFTITVVITHEAASAVTVTSTANVSGPIADLAMAKTVQPR